ncbi:hypothetical protein MAC_05112 [Metarhizium acridum CQMa 102]|uniref:Uncharacterized protein n=1 Tax=Metarhizium acridum (strain CQMa 102) TaxID=655827 RepID=E9E5G4_METAQ|nr:uncharacterized protein MAC_05112 [Metarhizium acridum CQMa 102]EFY88847.1 hypothetical protein MAC_05112 [Metarhizium acridum CQMa 102]
MSSGENKKEKFVLSDEEDRPYIVGSRSPGFRVGDQVYLLLSDGSRDGPYLVATVISAQECTLSLENGQSVGHGEVIPMARLEAA